jgi:hypothetical protein
MWELRRLTARYEDSFNPLILLLFARQLKSSSAVKGLHVRLNPSSKGIHSRQIWEWTLNELINATVTCFHVSIHIYLSILTYTQSVGLLGRGIILSRPLPTHTTTLTRNKLTDIYASSEIRTHDHSVWADEDGHALDREATVIVSFHVPHANYVSLNYVILIIIARLIFIDICFFCSESSCFRCYHK